MRNVLDFSLFIFIVLRILLFVELIITYGAVVVKKAVFCPEGRRFKSTTEHGTVPTHLLSLSLS